MAKATNYSRLGNSGTSHVPTNEEDVGLLSGNTSEDEDIVVHAGSQPADEPPKTPRTPNRVHFDLPPLSESSTVNDEPPTYDDAFAHHENGSPLASQHEPFLPGSNGMPPPSRSSQELNYEGPLEHLNRPKSSLRSAMSNMANSIIGAGIIGQPYAFRQAGLLTGIILLISLTVTVDWTIRLIAINSKLSGRDSFQGTAEHCFGTAGLVAISVAQWAFAYGGMVAYGVVVGDSIPHVLEAVWPGLGDVPLLGLLTNRRVVIFVFIMGVSLPLSLYRDIAKVCTCILYAGIWQKILLMGQLACKSKHPGFN
jgi:sodium-coupled neutral amino acid transporter 11